MLNRTVLVVASLALACSAPGVPASVQQPPAPTALTLIPYRKGAKWGYSDPKKQLVIPARYDSAQPFAEGLAAVKRDAKWGYVDETGKEVIPVKYDRVDLFNEGLARVYLDG